MVQNESPASSHGKKRNSSTSPTFDSAVEDVKVDKDADKDADADVDTDAPPPTRKGRPKKQSPSASTSSYPALPLTDKSHAEELMDDSNFVFHRNQSRSQETQPSRTTSIQVPALRPVNHSSKNGQQDRRRKSGKRPMAGLALAQEQQGRQSRPGTTAHRSSYGGNPGVSFLSTELDSESRLKMSMEPYKHPNKKSQSRNRAFTSKQNSLMHVSKPRQENWKTSLSKQPPIEVDRPSKFVEETASAPAKTIDLSLGHNENDQGSISSDLDDNLFRNEQGKERQPPMPRPRADSEEPDYMQTLRQPMTTMKGAIPRKKRSTSQDLPSLGSDEVGDPPAAAAPGTGLSPASPWGSSSSHKRKRDCPVPDFNFNLGLLDSPTGKSEEPASRRSSGEASEEQSAQKGASTSTAIEVDEDEVDSGPQRKKNKDEEILLLASNKIKKKRVKKKRFKTNKENSQGLLEQLASPIQKAMEKGFQAFSSFSSRKSGRLTDLDVGDEGPATDTLPEDLKNGVLGNKHDRGKQNSVDTCNYIFEIENPDNKLPQRSTASSEEEDKSRNIKKKLECMEHDDSPDYFGIQGSLHEEARQHIHSALEPSQEQSTQPVLAFKKTNIKGGNRGSGGKKKSATKIIPGGTLRKEAPKKAAPHWRDEDADEYQPARISPRYSIENSPVRRSSRPSNSVYSSKKTNLRRNKASRSNGEVVEVIDDSTDSEVEEVTHPNDVAIVPSIRFELSRIAIGKKIMTTECFGTYDPNSSQFHIEFISPNGRRRQLDETRRTKVVEFNFLHQGLEEIAYFDAQPGSCEKSSSSCDESYQGEDIKSFVAFAINPDTHGDLRVYRKSLDFSHSNPALRCLVLEFRTQAEWNFLVESFKDFSSHIPVDVKIKKLDSPGKYLQFLSDHSMIEAKKSEHKKFIAGRARNETLLVFPFGGDPKEMDKAADGLTEAASGKMFIPPSSEEDGDEIKCRTRAHFVTISVEDFERLEPGEWLNDSLIDLWNLWISRDDPTLESYSHFFTSHFYSTLEKDGPKTVASWTERKKINIFEKKFIFIPINKSMHWSLCVVVNPGALIDAVASGRETSKDDPLSCMLFMDSLRMHNKDKVADHVRKWLNSQYNRSCEGQENFEGSLFTKKTLKIFSPRVPLQTNSWDCGVFVCRYAYAIYELRNCSFTYEDAGMYCNESKSVQGLSSNVFRQLISDREEFDFDMGDIARFREELMTLIQRLSLQYKAFKAEEKQKRLKKKRQQQQDAQNKVSEAVIDTSQDSSLNDCVALDAVTVPLCNGADTTADGKRNPSDEVEEDEGRMEQATKAVTAPTPAARTGHGPPALYSSPSNSVFEELQQSVCKRTVNARNSEQIYERDDEHAMGDCAMSTDAVMEGSDSDELPYGQGDDIPLSALAFASTQTTTHEGARNAEIATNDYKVVESNNIFSKLPSRDQGEALSFTI